MADKRFSVEVFAGVEERTGRKLPPTRVEIPDGKWVLYVGTHYREEESWDPTVREEDSLDSDVGFEHNENEETRYTLVGVTESDLEQILVDHDQSRRLDRGYRLSQGGSWRWLVCDRPFGAIFERKENGVRAGGLVFSCARQVHKGELGRRPQIVRPRFVREQPRWGHELPDVSPETGRAIRARDRRRGKHGWARLSDVAALANMPSNEMLARFWDFAHSESPRLDLVVAQNDQQLRQIVLTEGIVRVLEPANLQPVLSSHGEYVWIRQGFALTILYLLHLGYLPLPTLQEVQQAVQAMQRV